MYEGPLVLINRENPIRKPLPPHKLLALSSNEKIRELHDGMLLEKTCLKHLLSLLEACQGMEEIVAVSGYRTKEEQIQIYADSLLENGPEYTSCYVALPDRSEHQTGLAIDVGKLDKEVDFIAPSFPDTGVYRTFKQHAAEFGFVQRYKEGKETITSISCEPWHFRYVGYPHAAIMEQNGFCLEEYIDFVQNYRYEGEHLRYEHNQLTMSIYYIPAEKGAYTTVPIVKCDLYRISGNNRDGFIVTAYSGSGTQACAG